MGQKARTHYSVFQANDQAGRQKTKVGCKLHNLPESECRWAGVYTASGELVGRKGQVIERRLLQGRRERLDL